MSQNIEVGAGSVSSPTTPPGPGQSPMGWPWILAVALYLVVFSVMVLYGLIKVWPHPTPSGQTKIETPSTAPGSTSPAPVATSSPTPGPLPDPELISFFGGQIQAEIYAETRLLLLVIFAGALGSLMHSLRSLYWYTGNREMVWSWVAFYLLLPLTGSILAVIFYFVIRGGFFSPQASFGNTSPFGFAALSALVGLFSPQATLKLKEIAETIFTKPAPGANPKPQESATRTTPPTAGTAPTITAVTPSSGQAAEKLTIRGTGFGAGVTVKVGDLAAEITSSSSTAIEVVAPANAAGAANIEVINPDGQTAILPQGYTYLAANADAAGVNENVETIDGCDVDIVDATPDEDLPITEGGVA